MRTPGSLRRQTQSLFVGLSLVLCTSAVADTANADRPVRIRVTVMNVMAANSLSPLVAVALKPGASLFKLGQPASPGVAALAEDGLTRTLESEASAHPGFLARTTAAGGVPAGGTSEVILEVGSLAIYQGATLTVASMIGKSNDSFVALTTVPIRDLLMAKGPIDLTNYDAGSEENTGNLGDFGPGGHPTADAEKIVSIDRGLNRRGNAPDIFAWGSVAARLKAQVVR